MSNIPETIVGSALGVLLAQSPALPRLLRNLRLVSKACCEVSDAARDEVQVGVGKVDRATSSWSRNSRSRVFPFMLAPMALPHIVAYSRL